MIWSYLVHIGVNMWFDPIESDGYYEGAMKLNSICKEPDARYLCAQKKLRFDRELFKELAHQAANTGINMFILDLGEAIKYAFSLLPRLSSFVNDGRILLDNNLIENVIRPLALGRLCAAQHKRPYVGKLVMLAS